MLRLFSVFRVIVSDAHTRNVTHATECGELVHDTLIGPVIVAFALDIPQNVLVLLCEHDIEITVYHVSPFVLSNSGLTFFKYDSTSSDVMSPTST